MILTAVVITLVSIFLAMNMGVSGFSVSFAPSYGSKVLTRSRAALLYGFCVLLGGVLVGPRVLETFVKKISTQALSPASGLIIISSAAAAMFLSNLLKIPQSTSFVMVSAFLGAGLYRGNVNWGTIVKIVVVALVFSALSFTCTFLIKRKLYPPHQNNLKFYEQFFIHREKFKKFIIFHDMYSAFGVGTNNVANVVAPLVGAFAINPVLGLALAAPLFALGAWLFGRKVINTVSQDIIPIGDISATIVSFITATFVIIASAMGLPTPYVQFTTFSIFAISCVKDGVQCTLDKSIFKKIIWVWLLVPVFTVFLSLGLHLAILGVRR